VQTAATDTLVGRSLDGRYRILDRIARGGMSTVYAAVDERLDRLVAVKVMSAALSADPSFSDRFAREARAAARLTHLNVVSVYDQGQESGPAGHHVFLVMELVEGRTLRELLRERGRLSPAEAVSIMEPVLSALAAAHRAGLVHRDVKPENILLSDDGVVKVADFGLARAVEADPSSTRTGLMMGTVAYCAPEQISDGRADPRSDVYAAGVVLFELLTGGPPYKGDSAMNVAYQHVTNRVPAPSARVKAGIPERIDEIVVAATDRDPAGRPADAGALLAELADARDELRLPVVPVPPRERTRGRAARPEALDRTAYADTDMIRGHRLDTDTSVVPRRGVAVGEPLHLVPHDVNAPPPPVVIPPPKPKASPHVRRRRRALLVLLLVLLLGVAAGYAGWWFASGRYAHVPNVLNQSRADAISLLEDAGYKVQVQPGPVFDPQIPKGNVLRTDPSAHTRMVKGHTVTIVMSAGPQLFTLPSVRNKSLEDARATLLGVGQLSIAQDVKQEPSDVIEAGNVTRTDPPAGHKVTSAQPITIYVSTGPPVVDVPTIQTGTPFDQARQALRRSDGQFKVHRVDEYSDTISNGDVIAISPSDRSRKFSTITVTVSKGPEFVTVPDISPGTSEGDASAQLDLLGLVPDFQQIGGRRDPVVYGVPDAGGKVHVGSTVTVIVI
jgi:serine/threonine-protein kinase